MKKIIIFDLILLSIIYIIPKNKIENNVNEIENNISQNEIKNDINIIQNQTSVSSRSETKREITKNYDININTDLTIKSNVSIEEYQKMLENTNLYDIAESLYNSEQNYGLNGLYIMGLACLESAYGNSNLAKNRNNLVGWNATTSNPGNATYFNSKSDCIDFISQKISKNYLSENGCYYAGKSASAIDKHYCTDTSHAQKIINIIKKLEKTLDK